MLRTGNVGEEVYCSVCGTQKDQRKMEASEMEYLMPWTIRRK